MTIDDWGGRREAMELNMQHPSTKLYHPLSRDFGHHKELGGVYAY